MKKTGARILILGRRTHGKTTLAVSMALAIGWAVVIYDVKNNITAWPHRVVRSPEGLAELLETPSKDKVIVYQPEDASEDFAGVVDELWDRGTPGRGIVFIVDEASWVQSPMRAHPKLEKLVRMGDEKKLRLIQTMHAPADSWSKTRSLASDGIIFRTTRPADLKAIQEQCEAVNCDNDFLTALPSLDKHEFVHINMDEGTVERCNDSQSWFLDLYPPIKLQAEEFE